MQIGLKYWFNWLDNKFHAVISCFCKILNNQVKRCLDEANLCGDTGWLNINQFLRKIGNESVEIILNFTERERERERNKKQKEKL